VKQTETLSGFVETWFSNLDNRDMYKDPDFLRYIVTSAHTMGSPVEVCQ
jgi:hypothetical protein